MDCTLEENIPPAAPPSSPRSPDPLKLETRGLTDRQPQAEIWPSAIVHANSIAAKLRQVHFEAEARKLEHCHTEWTVAQCQDCGRHDKFPNRCENFYCPKCQPYLSRKRKQAVEWWTKLAKQPKHVVLTVQNVPDLTAGHVKQFKRWLRAIRKTKFASNWIGGFYSLEVTKEGHGWHLHAHLLIDARWIDSFGLSAAWQKVTAGMGRIIKVKDCRDKQYLAEVTKYAVKGSQLAAWQPADIARFINAFKGLRTFGVFGSLYGKRTLWKQWLEQLKQHGRQCECGCSRFWYFTELEWTLKDLVPDTTHKPRPPKTTEPEAQLALPAQRQLNHTLTL